VFNSVGNTLRLFKLEGGSYRELFVEPSPIAPKLWIEELQIGLGLWQGSFAGVERQWLRWYDAQENWILTPEERERQRAEVAEQRAERLAQLLRAQGIDPGDV
jgi:hypothetical protein